jgi:hypothetical protein
MMRTNIPMLCARVGIAALASLGVVAVPGGPSSAAPSQEFVVVHSIFAAAPTPAECSAIREQIEGLEARIASLQELLAEATPAQKPAIIRMIGRLSAKIVELHAQLDGCPA